jgi:hypothetical protein
MSCPPRFCCRELTWRNADPAGISNYYAHELSFREELSLAANLTG